MPCGRFPIDRMPVTQADVARRAGVSVKQVSRVINHEDRVSTATRQRVMQAVADLGYVPNVWAQRLARGYSQLIGLCFYDATAAYIDEVLTAMLDFADVHAYRVGLYRFDPAKEADVTRMVALTSQMRVDGFVLTPPCDNAAEFIAALQRSHVPFVMLTPHDRRNDVSWVAATDEQGAYDATVHLIRLGHTRIGFIQGHTQHGASWDRLHGYRRALHEFGIPQSEELVQQGDWSYRTGLSCARTLLSLAWPPTAIVASSDDAATGVIQAIWERGWHCPQDVSVVGFDDNPLAEQLCPPLTTVRQPIYQIAAKAMSLLIEQLIPQEETVADGVILPTTLVVRRSTAPLAHRA